MTPYAFRTFPQLSAETVIRSAAKNPRAAQHPESN
jgi:hypothetical protein